MATVQHRDIPDSEQHEPRGASTAQNGTVYVADGSGAGNFIKIPLAALQGTIPDGARVPLVTDGSGGVTAGPLSIIGAQAIRGNSQLTNLPTASDPFLSANVDYRVLGQGQGLWQQEHLYGTSFDGDGLVVNFPGVYKLEFWATIQTYPTAEATVGAKFLINDTFRLERVVAGRQAGHVAMHAIHYLNAGDRVRVALAASQTNGYWVNSAYLSVHRLEDRP